MYIDLIIELLEEKKNYQCNFYRLVIIQKQHVKEKQFLFQIGRIFFSRLKAMDFPSEYRMTNDSYNKITLFKFRMYASFGYSAWRCMKSNKE